MKARSSKAEARPTPVADLLRFTDGAVVDPAKCPRRIQARRHWNHDGSECLCPPEARS